MPVTTPFGKKKKKTIKTPAQKRTRYLFPSFTGGLTPDEQVSTRIRAKYNIPFPLRPSRKAQMEANMATRAKEAQAARTPWQPNLAFPAGGTNYTVLAQQKAANAKAQQRQRTKARDIVQSPFAGQARRSKGVFEGDIHEFATAQRLATDAALAGDPRLYAELVPGTKTSSPGDITPLSPFVKANIAKSKAERGAGTLPMAMRRAMVRQRAQGRRPDELAARVATEGMPGTQPLTETQQLNAMGFSTASPFLMRQAEEARADAMKHQADLQYSPEMQQTARLQALGQARAGGPFLPDEQPMLAPFLGEGGQPQQQTIMPPEVGADLYAAYPGDIGAYVAEGQRQDFSLEAILYAAQEAGYSVAEIEKYRRGLAQQDAPPNSIALPSPSIPFSPVSNPNPPKATATTPFSPPTAQSNDVVPREVMQAVYGVHKGDRAAFIRTLESRGYSQGAAVFAADRAGLFGTWAQRHPFLSSGPSAGQVSRYMGS